MKRANMELTRISHYPVSPLLLDWADRHGLLIIEEGLNWQLTEAQLESAEIRSKFQAQMREMIERDWNHPCVIGWSVGNEYPSETPAGLRWTKDMVEWVRGIDSSRLLTFASDRAGLPKIVRPEDEASCHVDLVCVNLYRDYAERLDRIHALWPDKPVLVSEFAAARPRELERQGIRVLLPRHDERLPGSTLRGWSFCLDVQRLSQPLPWDRVRRLSALRGGERSAGTEACL